jgi:cbb3-type cytochrome oxidase cytochrome c subunit
LRKPAILVLVLVLGCSGGCAQGRDCGRVSLAGRLGCLVCHAPAKPGSRTAPLTGVGRRLTPHKLRLALTQPRQLHSGAAMPSYAYLPPAEQEALVKYLQSLQ